MYGRTHPEAAGPDRAPTRPPSAPDGSSGDVVTLGATVEVAYPRKRRRATYRLTGTASASDGRAVSAGSPVGRALMGRRAGDVVSAHLPGGRIEQLEILGTTAALAEAS